MPDIDHKDDETNTMIMYKVIEYLKKAGLEATFEDSGFVQLVLSDNNILTFGDAEDEWVINIQAPDGILISSSLSGCSTFFEQSPYELYQFVLKARSKYFHDAYSSRMTGPKMDLLNVAKPLSLPASLTALEPLLSELGYRWSQHWIHPEKPERRWAIVDTDGKARSVGMTEEEAVKDAVSSAIRRIRRLEGRISILRIGIANVLENDNRK